MDILRNLKIDDDEKNVLSNGKASFDFEAYDNTHKYDPDKVPSEDDDLMYIGGKLVGSRGNFVTITGLAKSRKTVLVGGIITAAISNERRYTVMFSQPDLKVLCIDTEQGYSHFYKTVTRTLKDSGYVRPPSNAHFVYTRDMDIETQKQYLVWLMDKYTPDVVIIDGITDFLSDINNNDEVSEVRHLVSSLSAKYNALFIQVIHLTKSTNWMTGAVGTMLEKKSETVIRVEKDKKDKNVSHVTCDLHRNDDFPAFDLIYDRTNHTHFVPEDSHANVDEDISDKNPMFYTEDHHIKVIDRIFEKKEFQSYGDICLLLGKYATLGGPTIGQRYRKKWFTYYKDQEYISSINGLYRRNIWDNAPEKCPF